MALEARSQSQVVTFAPQRPQVTQAVLSGGTAPPAPGGGGSAVFAGYPYLVSGALSAAVGYDQVIATDNPAAWWKLADKPGTTQVVDSANGYAGTPANVSFGYPGQAVSGNNSAAFTASPASGITTAYNPALAAITVECWVNLNGASQVGNPRFMASSHTDYSDYGGFELLLTSATNITQVWFGNGSARASVSAPAGIPAAGWTHLAATWGSGTITLYINGAVVGTAALAGPMAAGSGSGISLGYAQAYNGDHLTGLLAECAVYSTALSAGRIQAHYQAASLGIVSNAVAVQPGDSFQLWTGTSLKQPDVFTVAGLTPNAGANSWNIYFTPAPALAPASGDKVITLPRPGQPKWLGALGHVAQLKYSFTCPGGPDTMSCLLRLPPDYRTDAVNPGRVVQVWRGANCVWEGKLDEPQPSNDGWTVSAHGAGQYGTDFTAMWNTWNADDPVNRAVARGLRWANPGIGSPLGIYLAQQVDSGAQTLTAFLNLICSGGSLSWMVIPPGASGIPALPWQLQVFPLPNDVYGEPQYPVGRLLVCHTPVPRTINADINTLIMRYQATSDVQATSTAAAKPATYGTVVVAQQSSVNQHGPMEYYLDTSSAGVLTVPQVTQIGNNILAKYVRASFAGPFTVGPGQLLNVGGYPVDLGCEKAATIVQLLVADAPYGGEVTAGPLIFMTGQYEYDNDTDTATLTPLQGARQDMATLIAAMYPGKFG
jgi:Concanavalin A-like lectin/glucanases superfamily